MAGPVRFRVESVKLAHNHLDNLAYNEISTSGEPPAESLPDHPSETSIELGDTHLSLTTTSPRSPEPEQPEQHGAMSMDLTTLPTSTEMLGDYYFIIHHEGRRISPADKKYAPGAFPMELPAEPNGLTCGIIDLTIRLDEPGQITLPSMSWDRADEYYHGLSLGKNHGYIYVDTDPFEDRRNLPWKKPPNFCQILKKHNCIFLDSDRHHHLDLDMNYKLHPDTNSLALQNHKNNMDIDKVYLNTGFIVLQNNETFEILKECPGLPTNEGGFGTYDCVEFRKNRPGKPCTEAQGGFGSTSGYDPKDIKDLWTCTEANIKVVPRESIPGALLEKFIKHLMDKKPKVVIGQQVPGALLEMFHNDNSWTRQSSSKARPDTEGF
ncbi:hypothetical protein CEK25_008185 [Fusarium fujikuroi]|nr:hypothetical protein CEK25_008185 [Fusarium fujikuroi]